MDIQTLIAIGIVLAIIFASMVLHELMHGLAAYCLGDDTARGEGRLTLNPIKHIDPFMTIILPLILLLSGMPIFGGAKPVPFNPDKLRGGVWGVALVGIVGPLTNLVLAFICFVMMLIFAGSGDFVLEVLRYGMMVNLGFFAFNILPIPPLDGSRVLYAVAPDYARRFLEMLEMYGVWILFGLIFVPAIIGVDPIIGQVISTISGYTIDGFRLIVAPFIH